MKLIAALTGALALTALAWGLAPRGEAAAGVCTGVANYCTDANGQISYTLTRQPGDRSDCIWSLDVDFGDGTHGHYSFNGSPLTASHTFPHPGLYSLHGTASGGHSPSGKWTCPDYSLTVSVEYPVNEPCAHEAGETFTGTAGPDRLSSGKGADLVQGGPGDDVIDGGEGGDCLNGEGDVDWVKGGLGADKLNGGADADLLDGKGDNDLVDGSDGDDFVIGGAGQDRLIGGPGADILSDGLGKNAYSAGDGDDIVSARQSIGEVVNCGPGADVAYVDKKDRPVGCERVFEAGAPKLGWPDNLDRGEGARQPFYAVLDGVRTLQGTLTSFVRKWAPLVYLYPGERFLPDIANDYIQTASLRFAHTRCPDHEIKRQGTIDPFKLSSKAWHHGADWTKTPYFHEKTRQNCIGHHGRSYSTADYTRPHDDNALENPRGSRGEGFFLDIPNSATARAGRDPSLRPVPVYFECCFLPSAGGWAITYWFFYAYDYKPVAGGFSTQEHEADWERISILFGPALEPERVAYFAHDPAGSYPGYTECAWSEVESEGHPVVYSAQGSHASYPEGRTWGLKGLGDWFADDYAAAGTPWRTWEHISNARTQAWWGYGGGWGQNYDIGFDSGPLGPSPWKFPYPKAWNSGGEVLEDRC